MKIRTGKKPSIRASRKGLEVYDIQCPAADFQLRLPDHRRAGL
jgi:hypothetical protein